LDTPCPGQLQRFLKLSCCLSIPFSKDQAEVASDITNAMLPEVLKLSFTQLGRRQVF
jgi:hypothetical protein